MGKVEAFSLPGFDLWFWPADHKPHHFHVRKPGKWEIRVFFLLCHADHLEFDLKWPSEPGRGPSSTERKRILEQTLKHRTALLNEWEHKVRRDG